MGSLNIQFATVLPFSPIPSWRATSSTEARKAFDSRFPAGPIGSAEVVSVLEDNCVGLVGGLGVGTWARGKVKSGFISLELRLGLWPQVCKLENEFAKVQRK